MQMAKSLNSCSLLRPPYHDKHALFICISRFSFTLLSLVFCTLLSGEVSHFRDDSITEVDDYRRMFLMNRPRAVILISECNPELMIKAQSGREFVGNLIKMVIWTRILCDLRFRCK